MTAGIKTSTAVTGRNQEQILVEGLLQKDSSKPSAEEKRHGVSHTNKCKKNKINLLEGRKKASLETLLPFWPPSKIWAYRTHFVEQRYVRWEAGEIISVGVSRLLSRKEKEKARENLLPKE